MIPAPRKPRTKSATAVAAAPPDPALAPAANAAEWTVSELAGALKRTLEDRFGHVRLRGEIFGYRGPHASGHAYFCLKDRDARIDAVIWKTSFARLKLKPQEGLEVIATGRITTFPGKSTYQIVVEHLEPAGIGALMALLDERKRRLTAEGLFAEARKRPLPFLPAVVGVVTSPTGAVIRDILHRLADRFPRRVLVWPVRVQGETCGDEVAAAVAGFNALAPGGAIPRPDLLIVARGGGSLEDLWGFNDEAVVRAVVASAIPVIAAVGHETDWTLIDLAADRRAPTPTGAAEMAVPVRADLLANLRTLDGRREEAMRRGLDGRRTELRSASRALPSPDALLGAHRQRLDLLGARLGPALLANARGHERRLRAVGEALGRHTPRTELAAARARLASLPGRSADAMRRLVAQRQARLDERVGGLGIVWTRYVDAERSKVAQCRERVDALLDRARRAARGRVAQLARDLAARSDLMASLGYRSVLARGYALVRDAAERPVMSAGAVVAGQALTIEFADGRRRVQADGSRVRRRGDALAQPLLFDM